MYIILIYRSIYSWIESYNFWGICKYRIAVYENRYRIESWRTIRFTSLVISDSTAVLRSYENSFCVQNPPENNDFIQQFVSSTSPWHHFGEYHEACYDLNVIRVSVMLLTQNVHVRRVYIQIIASHYYYTVLWAQKMFSYLCKMTVESLTSHGLFHRCPCYVSVSWSW